MSYSTWLRNHFTFAESTPAPAGREAVWYACKVCRGMHWIGQPPTRGDLLGDVFRDALVITRAGPRCRRLAQKETR